MQSIEETLPPNLSFFQFRASYLRARRGAAMEEVQVGWQKYKVVHNRVTKKKVPELRKASLTVSAIPTPIRSATGMTSVLQSVPTLLGLPADILRIIVSTDLAVLTRMVRTCRILRTRLMSHYVSVAVSAPIRGSELRTFIADERTKKGMVHSRNGAHRILLLTMTHTKKKETHKWYFREETKVTQKGRSTTSEGMMMVRERTLDHYIGAQIDRVALHPGKDSTFIQTAIDVAVRQILEITRRGTMRLEDKVYRHVLLRRGCGVEAVDEWMRKRAE